MSVSFARRFALLLTLSAVSLATFRCGSLRYYFHPEVFCKKGNDSPSKPLICVDDATLTANPHNAEIYDVEVSREHKATDRPVVINWYSQRTADLQIEFKNKSCTENVQCDGRGHCWTTVKIRLKKGETKRCTYSMTLGGTKFDPDDDIVVNPCCW